MTSFLLDTNLVSEYTKRRPNPGAITWLEQAEDRYLSVLSFGEAPEGSTPPDAE